MAFKTDAQRSSDTARGAWLSDGLLPRTAGADGLAPVGSFLPPGFDAIAHIANESEGLSLEPWGTLVAMLRRFTATPDQCTFAIWDGYGYIDQALRDEAAPLRLEIRDYLLFTGPLETVSTFEWDGFHQVPDLCWPKDRSWLVATDTDLAATYVAGGDSLIESVVASSLVARRATADESLDGDD